MPDSNNNDNKHIIPGHQNQYPTHPRTSIDVQISRHQSVDNGNEIEDDNSQPFIVKLFPFTTALTLIMLMFINSDFFLSNPTGATNISATNTDIITTRILQEDGVEVYCADKQYSTVTELSYTYYLETTIGTAVNETIKSLEHEILKYLADDLLFCNIRDSGGGGRKTRRNRKSARNNRQLQTKTSNDIIGANDKSNDNDTWDLVDEFSLKIVGISSNPEDKTSTISSCVARGGRECTVVIGALNLLLKTGADLNTVRFATRRTIRDSMLNDVYVSLIDGLEAVKYVAPAIYKPSNNVENGINANQGSGSGSGSGSDSGSSVNPGMSKLEIVVVATLISTVVAMIGSFILFKKVFSKQNCMSPCDGTGIDKDYIEQCNIGITPVGESGNGSDSSQSGSRGAGWNMNSVINKSGILSSIDENSIPPSDASLYSDASTAFSANKSIAMRSVSSLHSEQTMVIANGGRTRTPIFGERDDKENAPPPPPSDSSVLI